MRTPITFVLGLALLAGLAVPAAAELAEDSKALIAKISEQRKAKDTSALGASFKEAIDFHNRLDDKSLKGKLRAEIGKVAKDKKCGDARIDAVNTLAQMDDPKGAWKEIKKVMPGPKVEEPSDLEMAAIEAAAKLAPKGAAKQLLDLGSKAKSDKVAAGAVRALGGYREHRKLRVSILVELMDIGKKTRPGVSTSKNVSPVAIARWQEVGSALIGSLNMLTGRQEKSFEDWEAAFKASKKKPANLFED